MSNLTVFENKQFGSARKSNDFSFPFDSIT